METLACINNQIVCKGQVYYFNKNMSYNHKMMVLFGKLEVKYIIRMDVFSKQAKTIVYDICDGSQKMEKKATAVYICVRLTKSLTIIPLNCREIEFDL